MTVPQATMTKELARATRSDRAEPALRWALARAPVALGIILAIVGVMLLFGGIWLVTLGGSWYYCVAGVLVFATGDLLARRRATALYVYAFMLAATTVWSIAEVRFDW